MYHLIRNGLYIIYTHTRRYIYIYNASSSYFAGVWYSLADIHHQHQQQQHHHQRKLPSYTLIPIPIPSFVRDSMMDVRLAGVVRPRLLKPPPKSWSVAAVLSQLLWRDGIGPALWRRYITYDAQLRLDGRETVDDDDDDADGVQSGCWWCGCGRTATHHRQHPWTGAEGWGTRAGAHARERRRKCR